MLLDPVSSARILKMPSRLGVDFWPVGGRFTGKAVFVTVFEVFRASQRSCDTHLEPTVAIQIPPPIRMIVAPAAHPHLFRPPKRMGLGGGATGPTSEIRRPVLMTFSILRIRRLTSSRN